MLHELDFRTKARKIFHRKEVSGKVILTDYSSEDLTLGTVILTQVWPTKQ